MQEIVDFGVIAALHSLFFSLISAFVPWQGIPHEEKNSTEWVEFQYLINEFGNGSKQTCMYHSRWA